MLITCPECQFARNINASSIPSKAQLATCPRCKTKFRFRILHDEERIVVEGVEKRPETQPVSKSEAQQSEPHGDDVGNATAETSEGAADSELDGTDDVDPAMLDAMQEEIEQLLGGDDVQSILDPEIMRNAVVGDLLKEFEDQEKAGALKNALDASSHSNKEQSDGSKHDSVSDEPTASETAAADEEVQDERTTQAESVAASVNETANLDASEHCEVEGVEAASTEAMDAALTEQVHDAVATDSTKAEEEAIKRYAQVQDSNEREAASAHIVSSAEERPDIWEAIAAMGEEPECTEPFVPGCGAHVHILPWEDGRLGKLGRVISTVSGLLGSPVRFWRGINAKPSAFPCVLFFLLMLLMGYGVVAGWAHVLVNNWTEIYAAIQPRLPDGIVLPQTFVIPQLESSVGIAALGGAFVLLLLVGGVTHLVARGLGGEPAPFSSGVKCVAYSCGALMWLVLPIIGTIVAPIYFLLLYVSGIRAGYNLSLFKTVVLVLTVFLLVAASFYFPIAAGVTFM